MQQVHALVFSGTITIGLAAGILYFDYGFWHDRYDRNAEAVFEAKVEETSLSPAEMFAQLLEESQAKIEVVKNGGNALLEAKETYSKREEFLSATSTDR